MTTQQPPQEPVETENVKQMRERLEAALEENKGLKEEIRKGKFAEAGFDITAGNGKALFELYSGDASVEAIQAAAAEYGWAPAEGGDEGGGGGKGDDETRRAQEAVRAAQGRVAELNAASSPDEPDDIGDQIAAAEAAGDFAKAMTLKVGRFREEANI